MDKFDLFLILIIFLIGIGMFIAGWYFCGVFIILISFMILKEMGGK